jgi:Phospholipase_D-nuclease N-terminal
MVAAVLAYTFGQGLAFAALAMWIFVWLLVAWRVVRRPDIGVGGKILWVVIILVAPLLGLFVYFLWDAMRTKPA